MKRPATEAKPMARQHNTLFAKDWCVSDPTSEALAEAMYVMRYAPESLTSEQRWLVLGAAEAWVHFGAYGTGPHHHATESVVRQLRHVRRSVRVTQ